MNFFADMLRDGFDVRLRVTGQSMSPFLKSGSYVTLTPVRADALRPGDIVFFRSMDGTFMLHRLIAIRKGRFITKGDALNAPDAPVDGKDCLGKVVRAENPGTGSAAGFDMERPGMRIRSYLIAMYFRLKVALIRRYAGFKAAVR